MKKSFAFAAVISTLLASTGVEARQRHNAAPPPEPAPAPAPHMQDPFASVSQAVERAAPAPRGGGSIGGSHH